MHEDSLVYCIWAKHFSLKYWCYYCSYFCTSNRCHDLITVQAVFVSCTMISSILAATPCHLVIILVVSPPPELSVSLNQKMARRQEVLPAITRAARGKCRGLAGIGQSFTGDGGRTRRRALLQQASGEDMKPGLFPERSLAILSTSVYWVVSSLYKVGVAFEVWRSCVGGSWGRFNASTTGLGRFSPQRFFLSSPSFLYSIWHWYHVECVGNKHNVKWIYQEQRWVL